jgi:hypothetical protein
MNAAAGRIGRADDALVAGQVKKLLSVGRTDHGANSMQLCTTVKVLARARRCAVAASDHLYIQVI